MTMSVSSVVNVTEVRTFLQTYTKLALRFVLFCGSWNLKIYPC